MLAVLYNLSVHALLGLGRIYALFNNKAASFFKGRRKLLKTMQQEMSDISNPIAWFHCASLGEFEQARPVLEAFRQKNPSFKVLLTFFSPSGYEIRKNYEKADFTYYLPTDTASNARKFINICQPSIAFFVKYEFWYNMVRELKRQRVPLIGFSMIFRAESVFFKPYGSFFKNLLNQFDHIFVQDEASLELLTEIGFQAASIGGDTRFDRVFQVCSKPKLIPEAAELAEDNTVMVLGSIWPSDMDVLYETINDSSIPLKYIIAPHNINPGELDLIERKIRRPCVRFSQAVVGNVKLIDILIIDNIGMLSSLYQYGSLAYIGGAFRKALHNTLEAATFGLPILFGKDDSNHKFKEAIDLVELGGAIALPHRAHDIKKQISELAMNKNKRELMGKISKKYVTDHLGGSEKVVNLAQKLLA